MVEVEDEVKTGSIVGHPHNVILFNDSHHDMMEVVIQIMKAINCTEHKAVNIMLTVDKEGRGIVYTGHLEKCELVASILEEIRLSVKIESI